MIDRLKKNEALWELFTKKEEYEAKLHDRYGRFPYCLSGHRTAMEPEVSAFLVKNGLKPDYPDNKPFALCLTHDIDSVYPNRVYEMKKAARRMQVGSSIKIALSKQSKGYNPLWNFSKIMDLERKYDAKSSFYFLALEPGEPDFNFRIGDLEDELLAIVKAGWEVGLHGGHDAYDNLDRMKKEKARLEKALGREIIGYRGHFLKFTIPDTWEIVRDAGFRYDSTFGYADCVGFRNGMCHPFKPYNLETDKAIDLWELSPSVADFIFPEYMRMDLENAWEATKRLIDTVEKYRGVMTIIWHNTYMEGEFLKFYEKILQYCRRKDAWMTSAEEICKWWDKKDFLGSF